MITSTISLLTSPTFYNAELIDEVIRIVGEGKARRGWRSDEQKTARKVAAHMFAWLNAGMSSRKATRKPQWNLLANKARTIWKHDTIYI
jgi:hypothetical protein